MLDFMLWLFLFFVPISYTLTLLNLINALTMNVNKYINRFIVSNEMETLLISCFNLIMTLQNSAYLFDFDHDIKRDYSLSKTLRKSYLSLYIATFLFYFSATRRKATWEQHKVCQLFSSLTFRIKTLNWS